MPASPQRGDMSIENSVCEPLHSRGMPHGIHTVDLEYYVYKSVATWVILLEGKCSYDCSTNLKIWRRRIKAMNGTEKVVKHLEMTQAVVNRLGRNSFLLKSWSMTILVAAMVLIARENLQNNYFVLTLFLPIVGFWILDGYFLWQEHLFRQVYEDIRQQTDTDFQMDLGKHKNKPKSSWISAIFSITLVIFYLIEALFVGAIGYFF